MLVRAALLPNPLIVAPSTSITDFISRVLDSNQTTAVVVESGKLLGVVSVHDVFRKILPPYFGRDARLAEVLRSDYFEERFAEFKNTRVEQIMTTEIDTVGPDDPIMRVVAMFVRSNWKTVPVVDGSAFVGTVTRRSVLRQVTQAAGPHATP